MNHKTISRSVYRADRTLRRNASFLDSLLTRIRVWLDGRSDGKHVRYGTPDEFRAMVQGGRDSDCIERYKKRADVASATAEEAYEAEANRYQELLPKFEERRDEEAKNVDLIEKRAGDAICDHPHLSPWQYRGLLLLFIVAEAAFSIPSLRWSNLGSTAEEALLAVVAAIVIVLLCHYLGNDLRRYPLVRGTPAARHLTIGLKTLVEFGTLIAGLLTVTFFRWRGMQEENTSGGATSNWGTWALFALGLAFAFAAVFAAYETEFSGAFYGLDARRRSLREFQDLVTAVEAAQDNIVKRRQIYNRLLSDKLAVLRASHLRHYSKNYDGNKHKGGSNGRAMAAGSIALIMLLSAMSASITSCSTVRRAHVESSGVGTVFILLDVSASVGGRTHAQYLRYVKQEVLTRLQPGEHLLMSPIGNQETINEPVRLLDRKLPALPEQPKNGWGDNPAREAQACLASFSNLKDAFESQRRQLAQDLDQAFKIAQPTSQTYLLDGLEMAGLTFRDLRKPWTLIILSDGMEDSDEGERIVFAQPGFWQTSRSRTLLERLKEQRRLPNLGKAEVYFVSASTVAPVVARAVRSFWYEYLSAAGVEPSDLHYGGRPPFRPDAQDLTAIDQGKYCHTFQD